MKQHQLQHSYIAWLRLRTWYLDYVSQCWILLNLTEDWTNKSRQHSKLNLPSSLLLVLCKYVYWIVLSSVSHVYPTPRHFTGKCEINCVNISHRYKTLKFGDLSLFFSIFEKCAANTISVIMQTLYLPNAISNHRSTNCGVQNRRKQVIRYIYVSLRLRVQNAVPAQLCVGKLGISLVLLNFLHCNFRLWFKTP